MKCHYSSENRHCSSRGLCHSVWILSIDCCKLQVKRMCSPWLLWLFAFQSHCSILRKPGRLQPTFGVLCQALSLHGFHALIYPSDDGPNFLAALPIFLSLILRILLRQIKQRLAPKALRTNLDFIHDLDSLGLNGLIPSSKWSMAEWECHILLQLSQC